MTVTSSNGECIYEIESLEMPDLVDTDGESLTSFSKHSQKLKFEGCGVPFYDQLGEEGIVSTTIEIELTYAGGYEAGSISIASTVNLITCRPKGNWWSA